MHVEEGKECTTTLLQQLRFGRPDKEILVPSPIIILFPPFPSEKDLFPYILCLMQFSLPSIYSTFIPPLQRLDPCLLYFTLRKKGLPGTPLSSREKQLFPSTSCSHCSLSPLQREIRK